MKDDEIYIQQLENVIKQMLNPLTNIPFKLVIEAITGKKILPFDQDNSKHITVLNVLERAAKNAGTEANNKGLIKNRVNEVSKLMEDYVIKALNNLNVRAQIPETKRGKKKTAGYPDILFWYEDVPYYLECKIYEGENKNSSQRSFYFSPSKEPKVIFDTLHFLMSFEVFKDSKGSNLYKCKNFKILSLESLLVDVKFEFNSDNARLYTGSKGARILREGNIL